MDTAGFRLRVIPPTTSLPPIKKLALLSLEELSQALDNLRVIYVDPLPPHRPQKSKLARKSLALDTSVPDSGYASAEEEDEDEDVRQDDVTDARSSEGDACDVVALRADEFERQHTVRWLTAFTARAPVVLPPTDATSSLLDTATILLASFANTSESEPALTRTFAFPSSASEGLESIEVQLNDAPLLRGDHTSVGLQSWASSIVLAERLCAHPDSFGLRADGPAGLRVLELGAGTGLLSIAAAKILRSTRTSARTEPPHILATDYHPAVLSNLTSNVLSNDVSSTISVIPLDWEKPAWTDIPLLATAIHTIDVVLAADVIYLPTHASWIARCVARVLRKPGGVFWLIVPIRGTGRHEGMSEAVESVFPYCVRGDEEIEEVGGELRILELERVGRHEGVGRADEGGYKLYKIGWAKP